MIEKLEIKEEIIPVGRPFSNSMEKIDRTPTIIEITNKINEIINKMNYLEEKIEEVIK